MTNTKPKKRKKLNAYSAFDYINIVFFIILGIIMMFPFWNVFVTSIVTEGEFYSTPFILWPKEVTFRWYEFIFANDKLITSFFVTVFVTVVGTIYSLFLTTTLAYGLSKKSLPGRNFFLTMIIITMFFDGGLIPYYMLIRNLGFVNKIWVMIIPTGVNVWYFTLIKSFFNQIPVSLEESAKIDGASELRIFRSIILPLSKPTLATFALFYGVAYWNLWYPAMLYITDQKLFPLQLILRKIIVQSDKPASLLQAYSQTAGTTVIFEEGVKMATVMVATLPIVLVYPFLQKYFVKGIMLGSVKG